MQKKKILFVMLLLVSTLLCFWIATRKGIDPDFGWHLRMGEITLQHGIPQTDLFSYTMPHFKMVYHEWLTDSFTASVYHSIGYEALAVFFCLIGAGAVLLQAGFTKSRWLVLPYILSASSIVFFLGIRPQIISWVFVSLLLVLFLHEKLWQKFRFGVPLLFIAWANLHAGFALGIFLVAVTTVIRSIERKKFLLGDVAVLLLSFGATLINPFHEKVWIEIWDVMANSSARVFLKEWSPTFTMPLYGFMFLFPLSVLLVIRYRKKFSAIELVLYWILLLLGISASRNVIFWLLIAIPFTAKAIGYFYDEISTDKIKRQRFHMLYISMITGTLIMVLLHTALNVYLGQLSHFYLYPQDAIAFLKKNPPPKNLFSEFDWGGYLDWQYPQKKVFIDGRMPTWRTTASVEGDSKNANVEYTQIIRNEPETPALLKKYAITTVMIKPSDDTAIVEHAEQLLGRPLPPYAKRKRLQETLTKLGWKVVYKDPQAIIYQKKH